MANQGIGARVPRKEDDRLMRGRGQFVADIRMAGMLDVAFVRSPLAHARITRIDVPPAAKARHEAPGTKARKHESTCTLALSHPRTCA